MNLWLSQIASQVELPDPGIDTDFGYICRYIWAKFHSVVKINEKYRVLKGSGDTQLSFYRRVLRT